RDRNVTGVQTCALPILPHDDPRQRGAQRLREHPSNLIWAILAKGSSWLTSTCVLPTHDCVRDIQSSNASRTPSCSNSARTCSWPDRKSTRLNSSHVSIS